MEKQFQVNELISLGNNKDKDTDVPDTIHSQSPSKVPFDDFDLVSYQEAVVVVLGVGDDVDYVDEKDY